VVANKDRRVFIYWFMLKCKIWREYIVRNYFDKMKFGMMQEKHATATLNLRTISVFA